MRAYVTVCFNHDALLPYFIKYYTRIGVSEFVLLTYGCEDRVRHEFDKECHVNGVIATHGPSYAASEFAHGHRQRRIKEIHPGGWAVHADLDEFVQLPTGVSTLQELIKPDTVMIAGHWLDRVAEGGKLTPVQRGASSLEEQYPMCAKIRQYMGMNHDVVVAASYAPSSHHPKSSSHYKKAIKLWVHHFKWQENFVERMEIRENSAFVRGAHKRRVAAMKRRLQNGVPTRLLKHAGSILGI